MDVYWGGPDWTVRKGEYQAPTCGFLHVSKRPGRPPADASRPRWVEGGLQGEGHVGGDKVRHIAAVLRDLLDQGGTRIAEQLVWHHEEGFEFRFEVAVH